MGAPETIKHPRPIGRIAFSICAAVVILLPFIYLTSLALLLSAYVHGYSIPSRGFLRAYAIPSNVMVGTKGVSRVYSNYWQFCVRLTKADYDPNKK